MSFTRVWFYYGSKLYWPRYVVIVWSVYSLNVIVFVVSQVNIYTFTLKHRKIIVITTSEQYFSPLPEKISLSMNFFAPKQ